MDINEIFNRQFQRVYMTAMIYMKNPQDAEDIAQTVFLKYINKKVIFKDENHEKAWFITVTRNCCKDVLKSFWKKRVDFTQVYQTTAPMEDDLVKNILLSLPEKYREVLYMHYYEGYTTKEIGAILKRNESTVRTQLSTAREKLRQTLKEEGFNYD